MEKQTADISGKDTYDSNNTAEICKAGSALCYVP